MFVRNIPSFPDIVLTGMGYNPDDYEFIRYEYDYSDGKIDWYGNKFPRLNGLIWKHLITEEYIMAKPTNAGFQLLNAMSLEK